MEKMAQILLIKSGQGGELMIRWIAVFGCVLTVALAAPVGNQAEAGCSGARFGQAHGEKMTRVCKAREKSRRHDFLLPAGAPGLIAASEYRPARMRRPRN